jgi:hypothetical protein
VGAGLLVNSCGGHTGGFPNVEEVFASERHVDLRQTPLYLYHLTPTNITRSGVECGGLLLIGYVFIMKLLLDG